MRSLIALGVVAGLVAPLTGSAQAEGAPVHAGLGNSQAFARAMAMSLPEIQDAYPNLDCDPSSDVCDFGGHHAPQPLCPDAGPCEHLTLFTRDDRVIGYVSDFSREDWERSLAASTAALGQPKKKTIGPGRLVRMRRDYWEWRLGGGLTLSYVTTSGANSYGEPLDQHSIELTPSSAAPAESGLAVPAPPAPHPAPAPVASGLPGLQHEGDCSRTTIKQIGGFADLPIGRGSAISYANGGFQTGYDSTPALANANVGDPVMMCLISAPKECPPGDTRGRVYTTTDMRTTESWTMANDTRSCGGA